MLRSRARAPAVSAPRSATAGPTAAATEPAWSEAPMSSPEAESSVLDAFSLQSHPEQAGAPPAESSGPMATRTRQSTGTWRRQAGPSSRT